ncbi:TetR family transcriptional regulator [Burkholderiaceae bacterium DAT-1]|nr:TetR family transcriptional regulator [Burkholderiaceae bacterium DAT-1]
MADGCGMAALSMREVTKQAGIVPAGFYRHFPDMDSLGLALVDQVGTTFREAIRLVRRDQLERRGAISASVQIFVDFVQAHRALFLFLAREQFGGSPVVRDAISNMQQLFVVDLMHDLGEGNRLRHLRHADLTVVADLIVKTVFSALPELTNPSPNQLPDGRSAARLLEDKLRFILIGAKHWHGVAQA